MNILELKRLKPNQNKPYEVCIKKNLLKSMTLKVRDFLKELNEIKSLQAEAEQMHSKKAFSDSEFGFLEEVIIQLLAKRDPRLVFYLLNKFNRWID